MQRARATFSEAGAVERYLHEHIPLSRAMGVTVKGFSADSLCLAAPLAPNLNHRGTAFGGSVACLAILAGWSWLLTRLAGRDPAPRLVIQEQTVDYLLPISANFEATCGAPSDATWHRFLRALEVRGRGRLALAVDVASEGKLVARFRGAFVAMHSVDDEANGSGATGAQVG